MSESSKPESLRPALLRLHPDILEKTTGTLLTILSDRAHKHYREARSMVLDHLATGGGRVLAILRAIASDPADPHAAVAAELLAEAERRDAARGSAKDGSSGA